MARKLRKHQVVLHRNAPRRIRGGHSWFYRTELVQKQEGRIPDGVIVQVLDNQRKHLGFALYSERGNLAGRIFTRGNRWPDSYPETSLIESVQFRKQLFGGELPQICRLVYSDSDNLPGLIVDKYGDALAVQCGTSGMDRMCKAVVDQLKKLVGPKTVVLKNEFRTREKEGLPREVKVLFGDPLVRMEATEIRPALEFDLVSGQKTGLYIDQISNWNNVADVAAGLHVLDVFCNLGGFGLQALRRNALSAVLLDSSENVMIQAQRIAKINQLKNCEFVQENAFTLLKQWSKGRAQKFQLIVLDPPAFTATSADREAPLRAYKELHVRAFRLLTKPGWIATFSCTNSVSEDDFLNVIRSAAYDTRSQFVITKFFTQSPDHPVHPGIPESHYFKGFLIHVR